MPAEWLRTKFNWSSPICWREMRTEAIFPKPVLTPYTATLDSISRSTTAREAFMRSLAAGARATSAPSKTAS